VFDSASDWLIIPDDDCSFCKTVGFEASVKNDPTKIDQEGKIIKNGIGRLVGNVYKD
jgi:hypothetical protein